ncbi:Alpha-tubulin N-acetyltransferase [Tritrichomonas foetus]|uniref:Alpha-tubulin N-acetyltransferase n=1 Tax=Tritrichomonas foetus TaxID=1144522 RepID=A0A1J4KA27_9EUKA|nr:Alpha-tubulin N-acetyltransferase [Tritrichomonas foetus]|eukprot:OHT08297.1 Alpha-tubulin N-acetyltransferase [Tritrichomonas foetus]
MQHPGVRFLSPDTDNIAVVTPQMVQAPNSDLISLINEIGSSSSRAQGLPHIITTFSSFSSSDNILYILVDDTQTRVLGFVKIGPRHLFLWDRYGSQHEMNPICLLDFFTYQTEQRKGYGRKMIDRVLNDLDLQMQQIPIDRPSSLCLSFMKKHFGLSEYVPQNNKFVVFDQFWKSDFQNYKPSRDSNLNTHRTVSMQQQQLTPTRPTMRATGAANSDAPRQAQTPGRRAGLNPITWLPYD